MSIKRTFEFDSFGPWLLVLEGEHTLPPLFKGYQEEQDNSLFMFKIPRKVERRKANPDMHLYDRVIGLFDTFILLLTRDEDSVLERRIQLSDITHISKTECLLKGDLVLCTNQGDILIDYSTVSHEIISTFINMIRMLQNSIKRVLTINRMKYDPNDIDILYVNILNNMKKSEPNNRLIAYQPNFLLPNKSGVWNTIKRIISNTTTLACAAFIINDTELIIIDRSTHVKGTNDSTYSYTFIYIPLESINDIKVSKTTFIPNLEALSIKTTFKTFSFIINDKNTGITNLTKAL